LLAALLGRVPTFFSAVAFAAGFSVVSLATGFTGAAFAFGLAAGFAAAFAAGFAAAFALAGAFAFAAGFAAALVLGADFVALVLAYAALAGVFFAAGFAGADFAFADADLDLVVFVVLLAILSTCTQPFQIPKAGRRACAFPSGFALSIPERRLCPPVHPAAERDGPKPGFGPSILPSQTKNEPGEWRPTRLCVYIRGV
jgi:hypothetical protein